MEVTTKKQNRRKIVIGVLIAVVVLVAAVIAFASSYLKTAPYKSRPMRNFCSRIPARRCRSRQRTACG